MREDERAVLLQRMSHQRTSFTARLRHTGFSQVMGCLQYRFGN
jgi:hypothetical protein